MERVKAEGLMLCRTPFVNGNLAEQEQLAASAALGEHMTTDKGTYKDK